MIHLGPAIDHEQQPMRHPISTVFLDRDGVINRKMPEGEYVQRWDQFEFLPGAVDALRCLSASGLRIVIVTNQRGVALGRMTMADVEDVHEHMRASLTVEGGRVDAIMVCPHDAGQCDCRKPGLGLFRQAVERMPEIDLSRAVIIGDSVSDLVAGNKLGCACYFVGDESEVRKMVADMPGLRLDGWGATLLEVVDGLGFTSAELGQASTDPTGTPGQGRPRGQQSEGVRAGAAPTT